MKASATQSLRDQIVDALEATITTALHADPDEVLRSPFEPIPQGKTEACVMDWDVQQDTDIGMDRNQAELFFNAGIMVKSATAEKDADAYLVTMHNGIMGDRTVGGLAINLVPVGASKGRHEIDQKIVIILHRYRVTFRYSHTDLTTATA